MRDLRLSGIIPPIITPFDERGNFYERGMQQLVGFLLPHVGGLFTTGSYGSGPLMSVEERKRVLEVVLEQVAGRVPVVAHVGTSQTSTTVELAQHAQAVGAAAVGVVCPYYYRHTQDSLFRHYQTVLQSVSIPVYVYDNPSLSGNPLTPQLFSRLLQEGIHGIKDSSFDVLNVYRNEQAAVGKDCDYVVGTEALFLPAFMMGVRACIAGMANALPELVSAMWKAATSNNLDEAQALQKKVIAAREVLHLGPSVTSVHVVLEYRGIDAGHPRPPFLPIGSELKRTMVQRLKDLDLL